MRDLIVVLEGQESSIVNEIDKIYKEVLMH